MYYDDWAEKYFDRTFGIDMSGERNMFLNRLHGRRILDLGCGSCRDTVAFRDSGYIVTPADVSEGMRRVVKERLGIDVENMDFEHPFGTYDGVWACASLLHAPRENLPSVLTAIANILVSGGVLCCSFKYGEFSGIRDGRMYTDMNERSLTELLERSGFGETEIRVTESSGQKWISATATRNENRCLTF